MRLPAYRPVEVRIDPRRHPVLVRRPAGLPGLRSEKFHAPTVCGTGRFLGGPLDTLYTQAP